MKEQINLYQPQTLDYNDQLNLSKTKETIKNTSELDSFKFQCLNGQQKCDTILKYQFLLNQQKNFVEQDTKTLKFAIMIMENFIQHNAIDSSEESIKKFRNKSQRDNKQIIGLILCVMTHFDLCENLDYDRREQKKSLKYFLDKDEERVVFSNNQEQAGQEVKRKFIRQSQKIVEKYQYNEQFTFKNTIFEKNIKVFNNLQINLRLL
ncbi:unnamed protein product [Paramecium sonneborni]|uniref:Uncharacterized protein n=1 Tax=Paramecium sonneborni TaxID=65129 RepID=A0A8S1R4Y5_9CILI|nr:unnamed protein product [Paramecium sonneborni]